MITPETPLDTSVLKSLTRVPKYRQSQCRLPARIRPHVASAAPRMLFIPDDTHVSAVQDADLLLRMGYRFRNPLSLKYRKQEKKELADLDLGILPPPAPLAKPAQKADQQNIPSGQNQLPPEASPQETPTEPEDQRDAEILRKIRKIKTLNETST